jgi:HAT1-interacting factor 1
VRFGSILIIPRFPNAVSDFRAALDYKNKLYPFESEIIAEAHYKLSLALEFASITTTNDDGDEGAEEKKETQIDEAMREEAAKELESAIESTKLKLQNKEVELASTFSVDDNDVTIKQISEVKEVIADMEQRVSHILNLWKNSTKASISSSISKPHL